METEVKLAFKNKEELFSITEKDWFQDYCMDSEAVKPVKLTNYYFDTSDRKISARRGMVRVRVYENEDGEKEYEETIKLGGKVENGLHQRYEWNVKSDDKDFDKTEFVRMAGGSDDPDELLKALLDGISDDDLESICTTVFERTVYTFGYGDSIMEACFDYGKIIAGDKKEGICELELELSSGDVEDLKDMAQFIVENSTGVPFNESKFKRARKLLDT